MLLLRSISCSGVVGAVQQGEQVQNFETVVFLWGLARHALCMVSEMFAEFTRFRDPKFPKRVDGDFLSILQYILQLVNTKYLPVAVYDDL